MKNAKIADAPGATAAEIERPAQSGAKYGLRHADEWQARQDGDYFLAILWCVAERARLQQRRHEREMFFFAVLSEIVPHHQDFFGMTPFQFSAGDSATARSLLHRR